MPLDPKLQFMIEQRKAIGAPPIHTQHPTVARKLFTAGFANSRRDPVGSIEDRILPGPNGDIPVRIYKPQGEAQEALPILVFYHGGGWVIGDLESYDPLCRWLTNRAECMLISVDYRLAPEHKFPAAVDDAYSAAIWVSEHAKELGGDPDRIAVGGDSAGGNLTAAVTLLAREHSTLKFVFQLLIYPAVDSFNVSPSKLENRNAAMLDEPSMRYFHNHYMRTEEDAKHPLYSPYLAEDHSHLPPALVITAQYDPLRDEGMAYAEKLQAAGVPVEATCYEGMIHGFVSFSDFLEAGDQAVQQAADALKRAFRMKRSTCND